MTLSVSIIIPAYNAEKTLNKCLESVVASLSSDDEVIVVNDASTDESLKVAENFKCSVMTLPTNSGAAHARNVGAKAATKDIILFVDSDVLISKENVDKLKKYFMENKHVHSVTMNLTTEKLDRGFLSEFKNLYMNFIISESEESVNYIYGSCCATRKIGFISWPENMQLTEDSLWGYQQKELGLEIHCLKNIEVTHLKEYSAISLIKNDFSISSYFARSFLEFSRWKTLYTKEPFGHTSKIQKMSVILSVVALVMSLLSPSIGLGLLLSWLVLNNKFFKFLNNQRGLIFMLKSMAWYYFANLVYVAGISYGAIFYKSQKLPVIEREIA